MINSFLTFTVTTLVQGSHPPPPSGPKNGTPPVGDVPVDQYVLLLFVAALVVGSYFIVKRHKSNKPV